MHWAVAIVLLVFWQLGMMTAHTLGGSIHLLLVIAFSLAIFRAFWDRWTL
jgi:hypothetical protein